MEKVYKKGPDPIMLLKLRDMLDVIYRINRIKDNNYDKSIADNLNKMPPIYQAENLIRYLSDNGNNKKTNQNAEIFMEILKNIELLNQNNKGSSNSSYFNKNMNDINLLDKIKIFLKSLNDE